MRFGTIKMREQPEVLLKLLSYCHKNMKDSLFHRANNMSFHTTSNKQR